MKARRADRASIGRLGIPRVAGVLAAWPALLCGLPLGPEIPSARGADAVRVVVRNLSDDAAKDSPVTLGQAFRKGDFARGVRADRDGRDLPAQVDVKRRHPDGSVRFAVLTVLLDDLPAGKEAVLTLKPGDVLPPGDDVSAAELLKTGFDALLTLRFPDGAVRTASARKLLEKQGKDSAPWLRGPLVSEWILSAPPADAQGKPDEDLNVQFHVRAYRGAKLARVSVVVENCWDTWAGNIRYDASLSLAGREVFAEKAVDHRRLARWRKTFWWGAGEPPLAVAHDLSYLSATGALPNYDRTLRENGVKRPPQNQTGDLRSALSAGSETRAEQELKSPFSGPDWQIMGRGPLTAYMPTTGGRPEIAPYPLWTVEYLLSMAPRAKALVLAAGDLAGAWPIHVRARTTGRIMTIDQRPEFWLDERGKDRPRWKPDRHPADPRQVRLSPDQAHQPSLAYVPYMATGDYYYLEEAYFWANYCLLDSWPHPRENARGILAGQIRGDAWALRNLGDAAWIASDGDPEAAYFDEKVRNNLAHRTKRMYGPPEFNKLGAWGLRTVEDARIQDPANPRWLVIAPWEHDYLIWSLHHLVELGYAEAARPRDFLLRLRIGALTHPDEFDPRLAAPYRMVVGEKGPAGEAVVYDDWKKLAAENVRLSKPEVPDCACCYGYSARAAVVCAVDAGFPKAREALERIESLLPEHRKVMAREPYWAIAPGGAAAK